MKIAVLLPCRNEAPTIAATVNAFRDALPGAGIWVCDNDSSDGTYEAARNAGARVVREPRRGKGQALRRLFADVEADIYVVADGDSTYDASAAPMMIRKALEEGLDMVVGNRLWSKGEGVFRPGHHFGNRLFSNLVRWIFGSTVTDLLSGYRVLSRRFVKSFPADARGFEVETELTVFALENRCPISEVDTLYSPRPEGSVSKLSTVKDGVRILTAVFLLIRDVRPLAFFSLLAVTLGTTGLVMFYPVFDTFIETRKVPQFPTLIVVTGMFGMAAIFLTCGFILDRLAGTRRIQQRLTYLRFPALATHPDLEGGFDAEDTPKAMKSEEHTQEQH